MRLWWERLGTWLFRRPPARVRILLALEADRGPKLGRELAAEARVGQGSVYTWLSRLEREGLVISFPVLVEEHQLERRWYRITAPGRRQLAVLRGEGKLPQRMAS